MIYELIYRFLLRYHGRKEISPEELLMVLYGDEEWYNHQIKS